MSPAEKTEADTSVENAHTHKIVTGGTTAQSSDAASQVLDVHTCSAHQSQARLPFLVTADAESIEEHETTETSVQESQSLRALTNSPQNTFPPLSQPPSYVPSDHPSNRKAGIAYKIFIVAAIVPASVAVIVCFAILVQGLVSYFILGAILSVNLCVWCHLLTGTGGPCLGNNRPETLMRSDGSSGYVVQNGSALMTIMNPQHHTHAITTILPPPPVYTKARREPPAYDLDAADPRDDIIIDVFPETVHEPIQRYQ
ncbi:hypothetical protein BZG36_00284 [Bifiguratus adelaidae]|uniref:Transmembrane protein n=1 Tax=Bifiguratus adelaidae TaxID=1938954 RepID=A0A261Y803_9FUNG|nr:hypothetical protein BZG36_00284 [Bifiguratus adelaidae]